METIAPGGTWASLRRFVVMFLFAVWFGGFTFYAVVVVPTGHHVLRSKVRQGFITQQVTNKLNVLGAATLAALAWHVVAVRRAKSRRWFRVAATSWTALAVTLAVLFWLHPQLDALLDPAARSVVDDDKFYALHRWYLIVATVQWLAGVVHGGALLTESSARS
jgi:hypothetical protein